MERKNSFDIIKERDEIAVKFAKINDKLRITQAIEEIGAKEIEVNILEGVKLIELKNGYFDCPYLIVFNLNGLAFNIPIDLNYRVLGTDRIREIIFQAISEEITKVMINPLVEKLTNIAR